MTTPPATPNDNRKRWSWRLCVAYGLTVTVSVLAIAFAVEAWRGRSDTPIGDPVVDAGPAWFRDVTAGSGVDFAYRNGEEADQFSIMESLGGGVALLDYDGDGLLDIFVTGGGYFDGPDKNQIKGHPCKLYRNLGGWKFKDVTKETGLDRTWFYTHGAAVADYDRDGWPDLLVTGYGRLMLLHNEADGQGGRHFVDVTEKLGLRESSWSTSAGWADLDGDGWPDLYVCHYVNWSFVNNPACAGAPQGVKRDICGPDAFKPLRHALYRNLKGKSFQDVSAEQGFRAEGAGLGVVLVDINDDGKPDIYVANDKNNKFLFVNRGNGKLEEKAMAAGVAVDDAGKANGSMGVDAADYDGSGRPALWVTNFQSELPGLYRNLGREIFRYESHGAGIGAVGKSFVSFGTAFVDVDNDGWEDLVIANGQVFRFPPGDDLKQRPVLLHNVPHQGRRFFKDVSGMGGSFFKTPARGRGVAIGDLDNDGWPDMVVSHTNAPVAILRNEGVGATRSLGVRLIGQDHRDVVGSTISLTQSDGRVLTRFAKGGGSYLSASDPRILFGLGATAGVQRITVKWSWGKSQTWAWDNRAPHGYWELHEGQPEPKRVGGERRGVSPT